MHELGNQHLFLVVFVLTNDISKKGGFLAKVQYQPLKLPLGLIDLVGVALVIVTIHLRLVVLEDPRIFDDLGNVFFYDSNRIVEECEDYVTSL